MKVVKTENLICSGEFAHSNFWNETLCFICQQIRNIEHPVGTGKFTLYPESGKKRNQGNGVKPIKDLFIKKLIAYGWKTEEPLDIATRKKPGNLDAVLNTDNGTIAIEWETGNISSSHRALNKLCLGLTKNVISAGVLIVPSREMCQYLTDRIGNYHELEPYFDLWRAVKCDNGTLEIIVIEHDDISFNVPRIPKSTDGRAIL